MNNLFDEIPDSLPTELISVLTRNRFVRIERIVSLGHTSPETSWYDQEQHEWVLLVQGAATLLFEDGHSVDLRAGDYLLIPAHQKHRVAWTTPEAKTIWLAVFFDSDQEFQSKGRQSWMQQN